MRVVRCADSGDVAVYVDGLDTPLLTANDTTFGTGRVGFGSFDNTGSLRGLVVTPAEEPAGVALDVVVTPRCLAGKAYLAVAATNASDVAADVTIATAFGSRAVAGVAPGAAAYQSFAARDGARGGLRHRGGHGDGRRRGGVERGGRRARGAHLRLTPSPAA